jgi:diguanylate cyclase (GGDEF)-like protein
MDFDRFKSVNDSLGHSVGDELLVSLANRLKSAVRTADTVARMGGDEFAILLEGVQNEAEVHVILQRLQDRLAVPFEISGNLIVMTTSIGVVLDPRGYERIDDIIRDADFAMYRAKIGGKDRYKVFDIAMRTEADDELQLESGLRSALRDQEFKVQYLPVYSLQTRRVTRFEALLRWDHPQRGMLYPSDFLRTAEESGLIIPIGEWLLEQACEQMKQWQDQIHMDRPLSVSVNLSRRQFAQVDLVERIEAILKRTELPAEYLSLELAEMTLIEDVDGSVEKINQLHELGVGVEIDDFGTGYSSLGYLRRLPVNHLKIDRSFTSTLGVSESAVPIIRAIIAMASSLGIEVIAEGIETKEQADNLVKLKCGYGQGFFFNKPVDADLAGELINQPV